MVVPFNVPNWIKENKIYEKEYLKIAYICEGSKYKQSKNTETIKFNLNKSKELLKDGINFMNSLKEMLAQFKINTTNIWTYESNRRKRDGKVTQLIAFKIKADSINKFIKQIGWYKVRADKATQCGTFRHNAVV